ncbi:MAG TPA: iron-containing alcohol dehydrogenase family protein [Solirubrobacteraceae bacterium]|nr:iron-containing alcohol dehydrogenase family protein [Solirubrobacteraceae bacterium]
MPLLARMVACPLAVDVRRGAVADLHGLLSDQRISAGGDVAVAVGPGQGEAIARTLRGTLRNAEIFAVEGGTLQAAQDLAERLRHGTYDAVVGIGGGRTIDVAKYAGSLTGLPMVSVATSLAHDGLASPVASLTHDGRKGSYGVHIPIAVVVDLEYVARAPAEQLRSGVGDALSNLSALADWELAERERGERVDGLAAALARSGAESLLYVDEDVHDEDFLTTLAQALVLGGLAMAVAGSSRPCSGADHEIAHAMDALHPGCANHGEQVAIGALFATFLRGDPVLGALDASLRRHGIARVPGDVGLSAAQFAEVVARAPATRPERYTILEHLDMDEPEIRRRVDDFAAAFDR